MPPTTPHIAQTGPYQITVESGKSYWWCACGKSANQPFCDGSHKGSPFSPIEFIAKRDGEIDFCGCKHSATQPRCDGTHSRL